RVHRGLVLGPLFGVARGRRSHREGGGGDVDPLVVVRKSRGAGGPRIGAAVSRVARGGVPVERWARPSAAGDAARCLVLPALRRALRLGGRGRDRARWDPCLRGPRRRDDGRRGGDSGDDGGAEEDRDRPPDQGAGGAFGRERGDLPELSGHLGGGGGAPGGIT